MPGYRFRIVANSMFNSKLIYCISIWGAVWDLPGVLDNQVRSITSISKMDMGRLQVLQNSVLRLQTGLGWFTPTRILLEKANQLSVHQLVAYHTILQAYKCQKSSQPEYMNGRLFSNLNNHNGNRERLRSVTNEDTHINFDLSLSRGSFFFRASRLYNAVPLNIKNSPTIPSFKTNLKKWIKENIAVAP